MTKVLCQLSDYFVVIFQVAQNRLKFGMSAVFVLRKCACFFFQEWHRKIWTKSYEIEPPLCPSPNNVGFGSLRAKTLCVSFTLLEEGGWGVCVCVCGGGGGGGIPVDYEKLEKQLCHIRAAFTDRCIHTESDWFCVQITEVDIFLSPFSSVESTVHGIVPVFKCLTMYMTLGGHEWGCATDIVKP